MKTIYAFLALMIFILSCHSNDKGSSNDVFDIRNNLPGPSNTGYSGTLLAYVGPHTITTDGTIIENVSLTDTLNLDADNVIIRNFSIDCEGTVYYGINIVSGHKGIIIEHGEIVNMRSCAIYGAGFTARYLNVHDSNNDGFKVEGNGSPTLVEYCWIHHLGKGDAAHADGNQTFNGSDITFRYNYFDMPHPDSVNSPGEPYSSNSAFMIQGEVYNFIIEYNYLNGGNYTIYRRDHVLEITTENSETYVRNNYFGRDYQYQVKSGVFVEWSNNRFADTDEITP